MKSFAILASLGALIASAFEVDSKIETYGTIQGSFAKESVNSYKTPYASLSSSSGTPIGEVLLQTGWAYIPGTEQPVYHLGFEVYRTDEGTIKEENLGIFWAFPVKDYSDQNKRWEIGLVNKNAGSSSLTYTAGIAKEIKELAIVKSSVKELRITLDQEFPTVQQ